MVRLRLLYVTFVPILLPEFSVGTRDTPRLWPPQSAESELSRPGLWLVGPRSEPRCDWLIQTPRCRKKLPESEERPETDVMTSRITIWRMIPDPRTISPSLSCVCVPASHCWCQSDLDRGHGTDIRPRSRDHHPPSLMTFSGQYALKLKILSIEDNEQEWCNGIRKWLVISDLNFSEYFYLKKKTIKISNPFMVKPKSKS